MVYICNIILKQFDSCWDLGGECDKVGKKTEEKNKRSHERREDNAIGTFL